MFALTAPAVAAGSLRVADVAAAQQGLWFVVWMPVAFAVYCLGVVGFSVWGPFVGRGRRRPRRRRARPSRPASTGCCVLAGRYALLAAGAAFAVPLFLGGGAGPLLPGWAVGAGQDAAAAGRRSSRLRRRLPALRPDRFVEVGWLVLLPAVLLQAARRRRGRGRDEAEGAEPCWLGVGRSGCSAWSPCVAGVVVFVVDSMARATYALAVSFVAVGAGAAAARPATTSAWSPC